MKLSVVLGVTHMLLGVCLSLCNHLYFGDRVSALFEFIPRLLFLLCLFGYMDFMILYKWCVDWTEAGQNKTRRISKHTRAQHERWCHALPCCLSCLVVVLRIVFSRRWPCP